ncbi:MAG: ABC transporter permease [Actinobacteria bacterium]|nr:MAG: ABC transporter permease [Actinomycetota bacterium]
MSTLVLPVPRAVPQVLTLTLRTLRDRWRSSVGWGIGLVLIAVMQLAVYPSVASSSEGMQAFVDQWPEALREAFGLDAYTTGAGYLNAELFSMMIPLVLIALATTAAAAATAGEEERGTADLLLSLPISRGRVMAAKVLAGVITVVLVAVAAWLTIAVGAPLVDLEIAAADLAAGFVMTTLLALFFGAVTLLIGAATGKRPVALGVGVGLALAAFLLNALAPLADWLEPWQDASPFKWALGAEPLLTGIDWPMAALLLGLSVLLGVLAEVAYHRHDVGGR